MDQTQDRVVPVDLAQQRIVQAARGAREEGPAQANVLHMDARVGAGRAHLTIADENCLAIGQNDLLTAEHVNDRLALFGAGEQDVVILDHRGAVPADCR